MDEGVMPPETGSWQAQSTRLVQPFGPVCHGILWTLGSAGCRRSPPGLAFTTRELLCPGSLCRQPRFGRPWSVLPLLHPAAVWSRLLEEALKAIDPASALAAAVQFASQAYRRHPEDWKQARQEVHEEWLLRHQWNDNSTPLNGALVCLALLYGQGDFYRTLQYAMALGHDADCNAATAGAIVGVLRGWQHIRSLPQCQVVDRYVNRTRPGLPPEMTISQQVEILYQLAGRVCSRKRQENPPTARTRTGLEAFPCSRRGSSGLRRCTDLKSDQKKALLSVRTPSSRSHLRECIEVDKSA